MGDNYLNLRRNILIKIIAKTILLGLSLGLLVASAIALVQRLIYDKIEFPVCIIAGAIVLALAGGIFILVNFPTEKKLARLLDERLALKEKVQTMFAYKEKSGPIYELQREDTNKSLIGAKIKEFGVISIIAFTLCILIGVGMMVTAIMLPEKVVPPPPPPATVPFEITEIQIAAIEELIAYVNASEMDEPFKANTVSALTTMLDELKTATSITERDVVLDKAIDTIYSEADKSSSAIEIIGELWKMDDASVKLLAKAINYYDWPKLDEYDKFIAKITEVRASFNYIPKDGKELDEQKQLEEAKKLFAQASEKIITALSASKISQEDELYKVLQRLATAKEVDEEFGTRLYGLQTLSELIDQLGYKDTQRELDTTFTILNNEIYNVLSQHQENTSTGEYAITKICALFSYPLPKLERPQLIDSSADDSDPGDGSDGGSGAIGEGTEYGSDDLVYDPFTGEYVEYGVILDKYYALMFGKLEGEGYTDEEKAALEKYFDILYGGFDEKNEENTENEN